ncbi:hypothetical protein VTG60DRAFT_1765 [Thermothelomyces hinnuleus]
MDGQARAAYESQCLQLRAELKKWESDWAIAHAGKKPGRDDIKQRPDIAHKYKQYNKLRDMLAGKLPPPPSGPVEDAHGHQQRKRTQSEACLPPQTPSKRSRPAQTPKKTHLCQSDAVEAGTRTPSARHAAATPSMNRASLTPAAAVPTSISPTPQKDGRVLGLFDLLGRTPSGSSAGPPTADAHPVAATPSKRCTNDAFPQPTTIPLTAMTPTSARFATTPQSRRTTARAAAPLHSRRDNGNAPFRTPTTNRTSEKPNGNATPSSATPSFLRRRTVSIGMSAAAAASRTGLARVDEKDEGAANDGGRTDDEEEEAWRQVGPLRLPRKLGFGRSLSSVVAGLRKMEEEAFGDDEEALREMEMAGSGAGGGNRPAPADNTMRKGGAETKDSPGAAVQLGRDPPGKADARGTTEPAVGLLSGFDEEGLYDSPDEEEQKEAQQQPLRQFKKRGQKRTTRLVKMRPTRTKRPTQANVEVESDEAEVDDMVPETQLDASSKPAAAAGDDGLRLSGADSASDAGFDAAAADDDEEEDEEQGGKPKTKNSRSATAKNKDKDSKTNNGGGDGNDKGEGVVRRAVRKVKATAHANFKRLKLRNSGAKGGPAHNSLFRRRR